MVYSYRMAISLFVFISLCNPVLASSGITVKTKKGQAIGTYKGSYALLIGVSDYKSGWPDLWSVGPELEKVKHCLANHGFKVKTVLNPNSDELKTAFEDFIYDYGYDRDNRLVFFYSGHGYSRQKGTKGYLVPTDAPDPRKNLKEFLRRSLDMTRILAWSREMTAKHALFLFDSCFSGAIFETKSLPEHPPHISRLTARPVRQYISAGSAGEEVPAKSVFSPSFVKALRGEADFTKDGYVTGTELGMYLRDKVIYYNPSRLRSMEKSVTRSWTKGILCFRW